MRKHYYLRVNIGIYSFFVKFKLTTLLRNIWGIKVNLRFVLILVTTYDL